MTFPNSSALLKRDFKLQIGPSKNVETTLAINRFPFDLANTRAMSDISERRLLDPCQ